ncbi:MAG: CBS domain-containing protein [Anaerolineae bacterium]|nr:CBS domain-containing protein [Anaerolineae bacterium]
MANYALLARDMMQTELAVISGEASVEVAAAHMRREGVRSLIVHYPGHPEVIGIVTYTDIVCKVLAEGLHPATVRVQQIAAAQAQAILESADVQSVARIFREAGFGHAPVVDAHGTLVGVISMTDLVTEAITEPD